MELVYVHGRGWVPCCIEMHINCFMEIRVLLPFITIHRIIPDCTRTYMCNADKLIYIIRIDHEIARY